MDVEFSELDFQAVEGEGVIEATLSVDGTTPIDLVLVITPFTFEEYTMQFGRALHPAIAMRSAGIDRAECKSINHQSVANIVSFRHYLQILCEFSHSFQYNYFLSHLV